MSGYVNRLSALNVAALLRLPSKTSPVTTCQELLKDQPSDLGLLLTTVELCLREKNLSAACRLVENYVSQLDSAGSTEQKQLRFTPGLAALLVSLYKSQGRHKSISAYLSRLAVACKNTPEELPNSLLRGIGLWLIRSPTLAEVQLASPAFKVLLEKEPKDDIAEAGFVASIVGSDRAPTATQLLPIENLVDGINVNSLLSGGVVLPSATTAQVKRTFSGDGEKPAKRRRRKLVEGAETGKPLDPERWLPLRDRSSYRPKGKKGKKRTAEATQGGVVKEETIELVGGAGAVKVEKAASAAPKKKRKGRK
ncbi:hypothetical protein jhhlp_001775 [Lomentospora prolificans]|uniref:Signal recognition particle SRP72 subunit RNA-binding domain-containing protein n=1 Tax=Lomentospora prolificans TaxID=41688 RepID=A0A2N3NGS3_9PEZI|nr:hypothetical protein jhhlp_001775 [Lomentospora prolificans]